MKTTEITQLKSLESIDLGLSLELIIDKYTISKSNYILLAQKVKEDFNVECSPADVESYYSNQSLGEDYELEDRRNFYGCRL